MHRIGLLLAVLSPSTLLAQSDGGAPLVLELPSSTRALGLGASFVVGGGAADGVFAHPGLLGDTRGFAVGWQRYGGSTTLLTAAVASGTGVGLGVQSLDYATTDPSFGGVPDDVRALADPAGTATVTERVVTMGYGRELFGVRIGLAAKWIEMRVGGAHDDQWAVDAGLALDAFDLHWALSLQNVGPGFAFGAVERPLPRRVTLGVASEPTVVGPLDVLAAAAVAYREDGEVVPSGGVEVSYWPVSGRTFTGRLGLRRVPGDGASPITAGAAVTLDGVSIEYAFEAIEGRGNAHRIGLRWR